MSYGAGYGLLILLLIAVAVFAFVSFIGGLIYARRVLGPRKRPSSGYAGWYLFYTVRFMARLAFGIALAGASFGPDFGVVLFSIVIDVRIDEPRDTG